MAEKPFSKRLLEALTEMQNPVKDSTADVGKFSYDYATLDAVFDIVKPTLAKHGLMLRQSVAKDGEDWVLITYVFDATETLEVDKRPLVFSSDPQRNGIYETYTRRYATNCAMGLAPVDSDAIELRGTVATDEKLKARIDRGIELLGELGIDATKTVNEFAGWETDRQIANNLLGVLTDTYKKAKAVKDQYPDTKIKEDK